MHDYARFFNMKKDIQKNVSGIIHLPQECCSMVYAYLHFEEQLYKCYIF